MWEQISSYQQQQGSVTLQKFKLNILGEVVQDFSIPGKQARMLNRSGGRHAAVMLADMTQYDARYL